MASGFRYQNTDLDSIFAPRYSGWPQAAATEFEIAGYGDIAQRYAVLSAGSAAANTDFRDSALADLATIFAAYGSTGVQVASQPGNVSGTAAAGNPNGTVTTGTTSCAGTKGGGTYTYTWHLASGSGVSFTAPNSPTTAITGTVSAAQSISGTMYCTISDGVTSVNTSVVSWSIRNTSMAVATQPVNVSGSQSAGTPSGTVTSNAASCAGTDGIGGTYSYSWVCTNCTATSPNSSSTTFYATVNAGTTDNASAYCTISDGVTSVNTNTISVALQNTTQAEPLFSILAQGLKDSSGGGSAYIGFATNHQSYYGGTLTAESGFLNGAGVYEAFDDTSTVLAIFGISGLSADPGQASLGSVTLNGTMLAGSAASSYTYASGYAQWEWLGSTFNLVAGDPYNGSVVRNGSNW
jgi:hypothetical protein